MPNSKPISPVKPSGMELIFFYGCPYCHREVPIIAPTKPAMIQCDSCRESFPIVPIDEKHVRFYKTMLAAGKGAVDPDFV